MPVQPEVQAVHKSCFPNTVVKMNGTLSPSGQVAKSTYRVQLQVRARGWHQTWQCRCPCLYCFQCAHIKNQNEGPTREELMDSHLQVTTISLAPSASTTNLEQLLQTPGSSVTLGRKSSFTGMALNPLVLKTSGPELKTLLDLLPRIEASEGWTVDNSRTIGT